MAMPCKIELSINPKLLYHFFGTVYETKCKGKVPLFLTLCHTIC
jgi:hypothetical protein